MAPTRPYYHMMRAEILTELERDDDAIQAARTGLSFGVNDPAIKRHYGGILLKLDRFEDAIKEFDETLRGNADDPDTLYLKGLALMELDRYDDALQVFRQSSSIHPSDPWPHFQIAEILYEKDELKQALKELDVGLRFDRKNEDYRLMRIDILRDIGKKKEEKEEIEKSIRIIPDSAELTKKKADLQYEEGKFIQSIDTLLSFVNAGNFDVDVVLDASDKLRSLDAHEIALNIIDQSLKAVDHEDLKVEKLEILGEMEKFDEALKLADEWLSRDDDSYELRRQKVFLLLDLKKYEEAEGWARDTYLRDPGDRESLSVFVMCLENNKKEDEILRFTAEFIEKYGEDTSVLRDRSRALGRSKRYDEEIGCLRRCMELSGENYLDLISLSRALDRAGKIDEALSTVEKVNPLDEVPDLFPTLLKGKIIGKRDGIEKGLEFLKESSSKADPAELCSLARIDMDIEEDPVERSLVSRFVEEECSGAGDTLTNPENK